MLIRLLLCFIVLLGLHLPLKADDSVYDFNPNVFANQVCSYDISKIIIKYNKKHEETVFCKFKQWSKDTKIVVFGLSKKKLNNDEARDIRLMTILLKGSSIIATHEREIYEDAGFKLEDVSIDTARYFLTDKIRAFGIRLEGSSAASCPDGASFGELWLYYQDHKTLKIALEGLATRYWLGTRASCCSICRVVASKEAVLFVDLKKNSSHVFNDLIVTGKSQIILEYLDDTQVQSNEEANFSDTKSSLPLLKVVSFKNGKYDISNDSDFFKGLRHWLDMDMPQNQYNK